MVLDNKVVRRNKLRRPGRLRPKIGCGRDALRRWVQQAESDLGRRGGVTSEELEREVRELRQANEIHNKASAYFA